MMNLRAPCKATPISSELLASDPVSVSIPDSPPVSAAVQALLIENGLDGSEITGTGKNGRITKADVTAYLKANQSAPEPEEDPFSLEPGGPPAVATKEEVRTALITYQTTLRDNLIASGTPEEDAKAQAMDRARGLLSQYGNGATTLGALKESSYATVVFNATAATQALS